MDHNLQFLHPCSRKGIDLLMSPGFTVLWRCERGAGEDEQNAGEHEKEIQL